MPVTSTIPQHLLPNRTPRELVAVAHLGLAEASEQTSHGLRYGTAHLAALRAASALLVARATPGRGSRRVVSVWTLLLVVAPELGEWVTYFEAGGPKRAAVEAGLQRTVTRTEADDMCRAAGTFINLVEGMLP